MYFHTTAYHTAHIWERGHRRSNEDSLVIMDVMSGRDHILLAVVADGIGGLDGGGYAASIVTERLKRSFEEYLRRTDDITLKSLAGLFRRVLYSCHLYLGEYGSQHAMRLGTTVSILCLIGRRGIAIQVGDSHLYLIGDRIRKIGRDHTDSNGHLNRCIGSGTYHRIPIIKLRLNKYDTALLCTDGFYRRGYTQMDSLFRHTHGHDVMSESSLSAALGSIRDYAYRHGECDNMSAVAVSVCRTRRKNREK